MEWRAQLQSAIDSKDLEEVDVSNGISSVMNVTDENSYVSWILFLLRRDITDAMLRYRNVFGKHQKLQFYSFTNISSTRCQK